ncbi:MAG: triphosphoribosyl-dephospho-CoA synthase [Pseudomonadota bacterium]
MVLFSEPSGDEWHSGQLISALQARGVHVTRTALTECVFDTTAAGGLVIPGFPNALPDGAFVRAVGTGTFEQVTLRLSVLHALHTAGVHVWNTATAIERCVDKAATLWHLQRAGLPVPATRTFEVTTTPPADCLPTDWLTGDGCVIKPLFGSQGDGIERIKTANKLPDKDRHGSVYLTQRFIAPAVAQSKRFSDLRILVSGGNVIAAMRREAEHWRTNLHQGGEAKAYQLSADIQATAIAAAHAVSADYCGVDLIEDGDANPVILEINSNPAWKGLQSVNPNVKIADTLATDFLAARQETAITQAFQRACLLELSAIKPGNVFVGSAGHGMDVADFARSASAAAPYLAARKHALLGTRIASAVTATYAAVGQNTNLGICLLCGPLASAALRHASGQRPSLDDLRTHLAKVLATTTCDDAVSVYKAISLMGPAGLGQAPAQDVHTKPSVTLRAAMALAADRDRIAQAYTDDFSELFKVALPNLQMLLARYGDDNEARMQAISELHIDLLKSRPDSHIARKYGRDAARQVQSDSQHIDPTNTDALLAFDADLKRRGLNPGTTADMVVATLFAAALVGETKLPTPAPNILPLSNQGAR